MPGVEYEKHSYHLCQVVLESCGWSGEGRGRNDEEVWEITFGITVDINSLAYDDGPFAFQLFMVVVAVYRTKPHRYNYGDFGLANMV